MLMFFHLPPGVRTSEPIGGGTKDLGRECQEGRGATHAATSREGTPNGVFIELLGLQLGTEMFTVGYFEFFVIDTLSGFSLFLLANPFHHDCRKQFFID